MDKIIEIIARIEKDSTCIVKASSGGISVPDGLQLPGDLMLFYSRCGGIIFFPGKQYSIEIVEPIEFVRANPVIIGEAGEDDISYNWFIVGKADNRQYITVDLAEPRLGRCYDSFWETHGLVGDTRIVANNFTGLIESLYNSKGEYWFWLQEDFGYLGDAYDEIGGKLE